MTVDTRIAERHEPTAAGSTVGLPRTDHLPAPVEQSAGLLGVARSVLQGVYRVGVHGEHQVPATGPVILAANHIATMDGPLAVLTCPRRPTYALAKRELFVGALGTVLERSGQIPISRDVVIDRTAVDRCVRVLREGRVLAIFPEGIRDTGDFRWIRSGAAYLAMVSGAPIVPVAVLGTRSSGDSPRSSPRPGAQMHIVYGAPLHLPWLDWPRRQADVRHAAERLRIELAAHVRHAEALTGMRLPGVPTDRIAVG